MIVKMWIFPPHVGLCWWRADDRMKDALDEFDADVARSNPIHSNYTHDSKFFFFFLRCPCFIREIGLHSYLSGFIVIPSDSCIINS